MPSVMFWNIARAGSDYKAEELRDSLAVLTHKIQPAAIVLCEMLKMDKLLKFGIAPKGYVYVKPLRDIKQVYAKGTTLRYYVYAPNPGVTATLVATSQSRPVMHLAVGVICLIATHAPSVTATSKPQAKQMMEGYEEAVKMAKAKKAPADPVAIFGDLNVNLKSKKRTKSLGTALVDAKSPLALWHPRGPGCATQARGGELDWALCDPGFKPKVEIINTGAVKVVPFDQLDSDDEYEPEDDGVDKDSDHFPILISW
jgi:hypothetical protein